MSRIKQDTYTLYHVGYYNTKNQFITMFETDNREEARDYVLSADAPHNEYFVKEFKRYKYNTLKAPLRAPGSPVAEYGIDEIKKNKTDKQCQYELHTQDECSNITVEQLSHCLQFNDPISISFDGQYIPLNPQTLRKYGNYLVKYVFNGVEGFMIELYNRALTRDEYNTLERR